MPSWSCRAVKLLRLLSITLVAAAVACQDSPPARRAEVTPIDPATTGDIEVRVVYRGEVPPARRVVMSSAPQCALVHEEPVYEEKLVVQDGNLSNAIVWIGKGLESYVFAPPDKPVVIDQVGCVYRPHVAVAMIGQPVEFVNSDAEAHNVRGLPSVLRAWNFMLSRQGSRRTLTFDRAEIAVPIGCDIHPWMRAYLGIVEHPYAAVTGADGTAVLRGVPAGELTVAVWHEALGKREQVVTLPARGRVALEFDLTG